MTKDRDGKHAGGSIVDTARANTSSEQIEEDNETPTPFGGLDDSGGSSRFGALANFDEFTVWQRVTVRDTQSHPTF